MLCPGCGDRAQPGETADGARSLGAAADEALLLLDPMPGQDELSLSQILEEYLVMDTDGYYARPDLLQLTVDTRPRKVFTLAANSLSSYP